MIIKRHAHACIEVRTKNKVIFIDPGDFGVPNNLLDADIILITHDHFDHVSHESLKNISKKKKDIKIYGSKTLKEKSDFNVIEVKEGDVILEDDLIIKVFGSLQDIANLNDPPIENIGYYINDTLFHPGDALTGFENMNIVLLPLAAPWSKATDLQKFIRKYKPKAVIGYHDITLNDMGIEFGLKTLKGLAKESNSVFLGMKPFESIEIDETKKLSDELEKESKKFNE